MGSLSIIYRKISELKPYPRNARTHTRKQAKQIAAAIQEFGFTNPVLIDESDQIIAGHGRVEAAMLFAVVCALPAILAVWFAPAVILLAFSALLSVRLARGQRPPCACFGSWSAKSGASAMTRTIGSVLLGRTWTQRSSQSRRKPSSLFARACASVTRVLAARPRSWASFSLA